jgi:hypothetical protein
MLLNMMLPRRGWYGAHFLCEAAFLAAIILKTGSSSNVAHIRKGTVHEPRQLQDVLENPGPPLTCNLALNTVLSTEIKGTGIVFAMKSSDDDDNGVTITSLGFHCPEAIVRDVEFEVYALLEDVFYADPERDSLGVGVSYDYRGRNNMDLWEKISSGKITQSDLKSSETTSSDAEDFYIIPFSIFTPTQIPPNGGIRSFFINTTLFYGDPLINTGLNEEQLLQGYNDPEAPKLLAGEATTASFQNILQKTRSFIGSISYETECATEVPSTSPSREPTLSPTTSLNPTVKSGEQTGAAANLRFPLRQNQGNTRNERQLQEEECPDVPQEVRDAVAEQVTQTTSESSDNVKNIMSTVLSAQVICQEVERWLRDEDGQHRLLPIQSSSMKFSLVITGDYRATGNEPLDMGKFVEDSINADKTKFTKELKDRSPNPLLAAAEEPEVEARTLDPVELENFNDNTLELTSRPIPSPSPTPPPPDLTRTVLLILIIVISGIMVVLAAFLLFKYAERRAMESRRRAMEHANEKEVSPLEEETLGMEWEKEKKMEKKQVDYPSY